MALKLEGPLSLTEVKTEFKNLSGDVSFSDLWGIAEGVPSSGAISLSVMLGKAYVFLKLVNGTFTNVNIQSLFTPEEWEADTPKEVRFSETSVIGSSVTTTPALVTGSGGAGTLKIVNAGSIIGAGGITPSQAGGNAIEIQRSNVTIINTGLIAGGGGAGGTGGKGGNGGQGYQTVAARDPASGYLYNRTAGQESYAYRDTGSSGATRWYFRGVLVSTHYDFDGSTPSQNSSMPGRYYYANEMARSSYEKRSGSDGDTRTYHRIYYNIARGDYTVTNYYPGGIGGNGSTGGRGAGYNQTSITPGAGALGAAGGINAGVGGQGGQGGKGGELGQPGTAGTTGGAGSPGNYTAATAPGAGGAGGAAGRAITGLARVVENTGTILGTVNV